MMADGDRNIILQSILEIENKVFCVKLTLTNLSWEPEDRYVRSPTGTGYSRLHRFYRDTNSTETVYYQPESSSSRNGPILLLPKNIHTCASLLACGNLCRVCGRLSKSANSLSATINLKEILAVHLGGGSKTERHHSVDKGASGSVQSSFCVYSVKFVGKHKRRPHKIVFHCSDHSVAVKWVSVFNQILSKHEFDRPKSLLIFINPIAGRRKSVKVYEEKIRPLFDLAEIKTLVIETERYNHARDHLKTCDLTDIDGVISIGGDGMFAEVVDGLLSRTLLESASALSEPTPDTILNQPKCRIGIIPAGSTDTVSYTTQGINDPVTSAINIILGCTLPMDVGTVFHSDCFVKYNISFLGYGYYGDCIKESEQYRWMGPRRYDWAGFKKLLSNKSYLGEISFQLSSNFESHPRDGNVCKFGCQVCQSVGSVRGSDSVPINSPEDEESSWKTIKGRFTAINSFLISCRCRYAPDGPAPAAHLGDGCADLVLVHECSRVDYTRHMYRCTDDKADQFDFPFVQVHRVTRFRFRPIADEQEEEHPRSSKPQEEHLSRIRPNGTSVWNCDGEVIPDPVLEYIIHPQVIRLFARGISDIPTEDQVASRCCCL